MKYINLPQRMSPLEHTVEDTKYGIFVGAVDFVDYERQILSIRDLTTGILYERVELQPDDSTTVVEEGKKCICTILSSTSGYIRVAVIQWLKSGTKLGVDAKAHRPKEQEQGKNLRKRFIYRKAYPGQNSNTTPGGFSSLEDEAWDHQSQDLTRDKVDQFRRTRTQTTGTNISVDEAGIFVSGQIDRPNSDIEAINLPDGSSSQVLYLKPGSRFGTGSYNSIPLVEKLDRVQEFGLDYPVPQEAINTEEYTKVLGLTEDPFARTSVSDGVDDQTYVNNQVSDAPLDNNDLPVGSLKNDAQTYRRKGYIVEGHKGTLVGYNAFDKSTYGQVLKPTLFPMTKAGRFSTDVESGYLPVSRSTDEVETKVAASAFSMRFPYEYNTTRFDITKEGLFQFEVGSTIPKENIPIDSSSYEHPHGAGRSLEGHFVGSVKLVLGKNRDEEDSLDLATIGQVVLRLGSDDASAPDSRRDVSTQIRSKNDSILTRNMQFWKPTLKVGDAGSLENKSAVEKVSLRAAFDGGTILRLGARAPEALRKHLYNGYSDPQGTQEFSTSDTGRKDSRTSGRPTYGSGDNLYAFHDLTQAGKSVLNHSPYFWSGAPITNMDRHGLSLDVHAVRDILLRVGSNPDSGQSLAIDLGGGMVAYLGKDKQSRSITATLEGGAEITISSNNEGNALQLEMNGNVNIYCKGNWTQVISGDYYIESNNHTEVTNIENVTKAMNIRQSAMVQHVTEGVDLVHNQGGYKS